MAISETVLIEAGVRVGLLSAEKLPEWRLQAKRERLSLVDVITRAGRFPQVALYQALADVRELPFLQPAELIPDQVVLDLLPRQVRQRLLLPVRRADGQRLLVLADPDDRISLERVERAAQMQFLPALADPMLLKKIAMQGQPLSGLEPAEAKDSVQLMDEVMKEAYLRRASDVHFEPHEQAIRIRFRVDGQLQEYPAVLTPADEEALINRIKVLANLDIAEQRMAQDGAMKYALQQWSLPETDIRVATIPTRWGERCTLRILGQDTGGLKLQDLGMRGEMLTRFREAIRQPHGMILVTGPTGSGKSTTLYAAIRELPIDELNVLTTEDPVEQTVEGITQVQVTAKVGFSEALRSFLRHDPDVILVGEMRDYETVEIGLRAAMTGHLVLSTLHTNDAIGAVTRLADIGAERFLIGSTLNGVVAQRLGRRLCTHCRKKRACTQEEQELLGRAEDLEAHIYDPVGCSFCLGKGFSGRIGFFEALWLNKEVRIAVAEGAGERELRSFTSERTTLWEDCCQKVLSGDVTLSDVLPFKPEAEG